VVRLPRGDPRLKLAERFASVSLVLAIPALAGTTGLLLVVLVAAAVFAVLLMVVGPAVWSKQEARRKAALEVLKTFWRS
jgi:hypothetical protein